ncbi:MAG: type I-C CRISPR-associated protein Cas7/Csd2 [Clostridiales bacterium]|jgi:CRISPR-associated protein Csd2|nr:type I-C CRISPR-associated protein Cas7/Csd2 [Clostridiales bacterium]
MNNNYEGAIKNRYEFVMLYDVTNGNPNGDPDAGNLPRIDPETGHGIVTDVCIKRKIRNFIQLFQEDKSKHDIYIRQDAVLNRQDQIGIDAVKDEKDKAKKSLGFREAMCARFFDIRAFGAVMTTAAKDTSLMNVAGQVRGPVQIAFGRSIDPIMPREITITRVAVTNEKDAEKKDNEMGRKAVIPYGLYRQEGYISANLARTVTGFSDDDLDQFWQAVIHMFDEDRSAARGQMVLRELIVFRHDGELGSAPAHRLFERVSVRRKAGVTAARHYSDYEVTVDTADMPDGVTLDWRYRDHV